MATDWITREISSGLQKLVLLNLDHAPALDVLTRGTLPAWVEAITHNRRLEEQRDAPRIRAGFSTLLGRGGEWPAPRDLLDAMPKLQEPRLNPNRLESPGSRAAYRKMLDDVEALFAFQDATLPKPEPKPEPVDTFPRCCEKGTREKPLCDDCRAWAHEVHGKPQSEGRYVAR